MNRLEAVSQKTANARWTGNFLLYENQQKHIGQFQNSAVLEVPFTDARELAMDILRHGRHVEVLGPADFKKVVVKDLEAALALYALDA